MLIRGAAAVVVAIGVALVWRGGAGNSCDSRLEVPDGFCASVFADDVGPARHLAVGGNGDVYVATWREGARRGGIVALRDTNGDGRADLRQTFGPEGGSGIALSNRQLYFATWDRVFRYTLAPGQLVPSAPPDTVVVGLPELEHGARSIAISAQNLFVNIGVPSNACERDYPRRDFAGDYPCRELLTSGGIWRFDVDGRSQRPDLANRFATGLRHSVALAVDPRDGRLYAAPHGIDHLDRWWPARGYSAKDAATIPSETLFRVDSGGDYGFPYCMHDPRSGRMVVTPAYADAPVTERCGKVALPLATFAAHSAPMAIAWKTDAGWGSEYAGAMFVALHGSLFHGPESPRGYSVVYIPTGAASGSRDFARARSRLGNFSARPSGLAFAPNGVLYVADDLGGKVWVIRR